MVREEEDGEVLLHVTDEVRAEPVKDSSTAEWLTATEYLDLDEPDDSVTEAMSLEMKSLPVDMGDADVARRFEAHDLLSAPVFDQAGRLGIDPALARSVLLTTVTDVVGFLAFLGLATRFLI